MEEESGNSISWMKRARSALRRRYQLRVERRENDLASSATDRVVREFDWGLEWTRNWPCSAAADADGTEPSVRFSQLNEAAVRESGRFFSYSKPPDFRLTGNLLQFTSAVHTPHPENNIVHAQWFPARRPGPRAVLVLPHWNARIDQHVALGRALSALGISALRLSLPYHDLRMPRELQRADYAVSSNVARTVDAARQSVIDSRSCLDWLETQGYTNFGIVGTSLGSCYAFLTSAHDERLRVNVFNLFALYFADVVWTGLTTRHIRQGIDGRVDLEQLRSAWKAITPLSYVDRYGQHEKKSLFIYGAYDTTFLPKYSRAMLEEVRRRNIPCKVVVLPCGHYTLGQTPFKFVDGYHICSFFRNSLKP
jgi:dienelactone hydrolase